LLRPLRRCTFDVKRDISMQKASMTSLLRPVHPGEVLREDFLKASQLSMGRLGDNLQLSLVQIVELVECRQEVTPDIAKCLAHYFTTSPDFWLNLQSKFDLDVAHDLQSKRNARKRKDNV
jgi:antitoxin HigA-1